MIHTDSSRETGSGIGGLQIDHSQSAVGHSDADVRCTQLRMQSSEQRLG